MNQPSWSSAPSLESPHTLPPKLLEQLRIQLCTRHYSICTEQTYIDWARRFILFHGKHHPREMGAAEVEAFLSYLSGGRAQCIGIHAKPGQGGAALFVQANNRH